MVKIYLYIVSTLCIVACNLDKNIERQTSARYNTKIPYNLNLPNQIFELPSSLMEISGISIYKENEIACIQDEKAKIYFYNTKNNKIISKYSFGKDGDYEDITIIGETAYVMRSDGLLNKIENLDSIDRIVSKYSTPLNDINDVEGLTYDSISNSLLLACKAYPWLSQEKGEQMRAIYQFELNSYSFVEEPAYLIDLIDLYVPDENGKIRRGFIRILKKLNLIESVINFSPTAIAIHPFEPDMVYILSSNLKSLVVLNRVSRELEMIVLDNFLFNQPEGMCFSKNGDLYISNEGKVHGGNIMKFEIINNQN